MAISGVTRELAFGIEVVEHDTSSMPLAIDVVQTVTGWGDAYSEDNGQTWETLTSWKLPYSWSIIGNVRAESAAIERVNGILGYEVYRDGEKLNSGSTSVTSGQTYVDNTNTAATPCYSVRAYYAIGGLSVMSDTGCLADDVAIETISASEPVAYPNPTTGKVYIRSDANQAPEIIVSDLVGERLLHTRGNSVDLSKYANGIYLLQVNGKVVKITKK